MRDSVIWFLATVLLASALFMVKVRHEHRVAYLTYRAEQDRRDTLNDEWGQLLIEENLWSFPHRIEKDARERLSMRAPSFEETQFISLNKGLDGGS
jgi:cell division protein FtsL